jgi:hypothetical protein
MQGSNNFWRHPRVGVAFLLKLMIKEDHLLACTTKMFEILVCLLHTGKPACFRRDLLLEQSLNETLKLTSSRSSDYSLVKEHSIRRRHQLSLSASRCFPNGEANTIVVFVAVNWLSKESFSNLLSILIRLGQQPPERFYRPGAPITFDGNFGRLDDEPKAFCVDHSEVFKVLQTATGG